MIDLNKIFKYKDKIDNEIEIKLKNTVFERKKFKL